MDTAGIAWTLPNRRANWGFVHEFQHLLPFGNGEFQFRPPSTHMASEMFSTAAEVLAGTLPSSSSGAIDFAYTWNLLSNGASGVPGSLTRASGPNYAAWRLFMGYLLLNFPNSDTTRTLPGTGSGGFADDLVYRWARSEARGLPELQTRLSNDSCATCASKTYFTRNGSPLSTFDRLQLLMHNWRVATYANAPAISGAEGAFGYPTAYAFAPGTDVRAWQSNDLEPHNDIVAFPGEVTANPAWIERDTSLVNNRTLGSDTYPLVLQPYGSEYWIVKSTGGIPSGADLVIRVSPDESVYRRPVHNFTLAYCSDSTKWEDGRLLASVVSYSALNDSLWNHPELATAASAVQWVDVDSAAGGMTFTIPNFGTTTRAALIAISLSDGPAGGATRIGFLEALKYRVDLALRTSPFQASNPSPAVEVGSSDQDQPTWSPAGDKIAYRHASSPSQIYVKTIGGGAPSALTSSSFNQYHPDWAARDNLVAFVEDSTGGYSHIRIKQVGGNVYPYTVGAVHDRWPVWDPTGASFVFVRASGSTYELRRKSYYSDFHSSGTVLATSTDELRCPRWSPSGSHIYVLAGTRLHAVPATGGTLVARDSLVRNAESFDFPRAPGAIVAQEDGAIGYSCVAEFFAIGMGRPDSTFYLTRNHVVFRDTTATPMDADSPFYRTGTNFGTPRYSFDNTRVAYFSTQNGADRDLFVWQSSFDHPPTFNFPLNDTAVVEGIPLTLHLDATDPDGNGITYSADLLPAGASLSGSTFEWEYPVAGPDWNRIIFRAVSAGGAHAQKVVWIAVFPGPNEVADLVGDAGRTTAALGWTEAIQEEHEADGYDVRYQADIPITEANFYSATPISPPPTPGPGETPHCIDIDDLDPCTTYYFAIKTLDEDLWSRVSNVASVETDCEGSSEVLCDGGSIIAGGGGGEELRIEPLTHLDHAPGSALSNSAYVVSAQNSVLWHGARSNAVDLCRMPNPSSDETYRLTLRETGSSAARLDHVELGYVDHDLDSDVLVTGDSILVGQVSSLWRSDSASESADRTTLANVASNRSAGEIMAFALGSRPGPTAVFVESKGRMRVAKRDSVGIRVEARRGRSPWSEVGTIVPRRDFDRSALLLADSDSVRLSFLGSYDLQEVGIVEVASIVRPRPLTLESATHVRFGSVVTAVGDDDGESIPLDPSDRVDLAFELQQGVPGKQRNYFLWLRGEYETESTQPGPAIEVAPPIPMSFALGSPYPNPGRASVSIAYAVPAQSFVTVQVFDASGRLVRTLLKGQQEPGQRVLVWDSRDGSGSKVRAGVYFFRMDAGAWQGRRKVVLLQP